MREPLAAAFILATALHAVPAGAATRADPSQDEFARRCGVNLATLHPVSRNFLDYFLAGQLPLVLFRRYFHLPNSDYLAAGQCLARHFKPPPLPRLPSFD